MSAYDIQQELQQRGRRLSPMSVYRCLARLMADGVVHRVQTLGAYVACTCEHSDGRASGFAICLQCKAVEEFDCGPARSSRVESSIPAGFVAATVALEVQGTCRTCQESMVK